VDELPQERKEMYGIIEGVDLVGMMIKDAHRWIVIWLNKVKRRFFYSHGV